MYVGVCIYIYTACMCERESMYTYIYTHNGELVCHFPYKYNIVAAAKAILISCTMKLLCLVTWQVTFFIFLKSTRTKHFMFKFYATLSYETYCK